MNEGTLSTAQAAHMLGLTEGTLRNWRRDGIGPKSYKPNEGRTARVFYYESEIREWIEKGKQS